MHAQPPNLEFVTCGSVSLAPTCRRSFPYSLTKSSYSDVYVFSREPAWEHCMCSIRSCTCELFMHCKLPGMNVRITIIETQSQVVLSCKGAAQRSHGELGSPFTRSETGCAQVVEAIERARNWSHSRQSAAGVALRSLGCATTTIGTVNDECRVVFGGTATEFCPVAFGDAATANGTATEFCPVASDEAGAIGTSD